MPVLPPKFSLCVKTPPLNVAPPVPVKFWIFTKSIHTVPEALESVAAVPPLDLNMIGKLPVPTAIISPLII